MKKIKFILTVVAAILFSTVACENPSVEIEEINAVQDNMVSQKHHGDKNEKVDICHYDADLNESFHLTISVNGLNGHGDHEYDLFEGDEGYEDLDEDGILDCADCALDNPDMEASSKKMWYRDYDGDGYGDPENYIESCYDRSDMGYVMNMDDCDDMNADLNPETMWYADADGDGYGNPDVYMTQCEQPDGYVMNMDDCDDAKLPYDPTGTYYMYWVNNGEMRGLHMITIDWYDGTSFTGTGVALNFGGKESVVEATYDENTGTYIGTYSYPNHEVGGEPFGFVATVTECDGLEIRPIYGGEFYGPVPEDSPLVSGEPVPND